MNDHLPVLLQESLDALSIVPGGVYIDGTFGRGGHSREILARLNEKGCLLALDKDLDAVAYAKKMFGQDVRFRIYHGSFKDVAKMVEDAGVDGQVDGILLDLGVSSPQLDNAERGFSFSHDGPLDMRMDNSSGMTAEAWVNQASEKEMSHVFKVYGEERFSKRISRAIIRERQVKRITSTKQLAEIVKTSNPAWEKHKHPATRVFQAIRIFINNELDDLEKFLASSLDLLKKGGRLVIISFHSLEDRIVKRFMRSQAHGDDLPRKLPVTMMERHTRLKIIKKALKPSEKEMAFNNRARSAVLRIGEKLS